MQSNKSLVILTSILIPLVAVTGWVLWNNARHEPPASEGPPQFLHCTSCPFERPYTGLLSGKSCPECKAGTLKPATRSNRGESGLPAQPFYRSPLSLTLIILTASLSVVHLGLLLRSSPLFKKSYKILVVRCPRCKRRLRCAAKPIARKILCPSCRTELTIPPDSPDIA